MCAAASATSASLSRSSCCTMLARCWMLHGIHEAGGQGFLCVRGMQDCQQDECRHKQVPAACSTWVERRSVACSVAVLSAHTHLSALMDWPLSRETRALRTCRDQHARSMWLRQCLLTHVGPQLSSRRCVGRCSHAAAPCGSCRTAAAGTSC
jgi:hypothetical protein